MKKPFLLATAVILGVTLALAGNKPEMGTIISENSVACGSKLEKNKQNAEFDSLWLREVFPISR